VNLDGLQVERHSEPFDWLVLHDLFDCATREALCRALQSVEGIRRAERRAGGDKQYGMGVLPLVARGDRLPAADHLLDPWPEVVDALMSDAYRQWVSDNLVDAGTARFDIGIFTFIEGDFVTPHTDKPEKIATHVIYLNEDWPDAYGGAFEVREGPSETEPAVALVPPRGGRSVLFACCERSWHAVQPVAAPPGVLRTTIQVEMFR